MKARWGGGIDPGARLTLLIAGGLLALSLALLAAGYRSAEARVHEQGQYCWRIGRRLNQNGDVAGATWSEDGVHWRMP